MSYSLIMSDDGLPLIVRGPELETIGRALTRADGEQIVEELNCAGAAALRDKLLAAVEDAIENCFDK